MAFIITIMAKPKPNPKDRPAYVRGSKNTGNYKKRMEEIKQENKIANDLESVRKFQNDYNNYLKENKINSPLLKTDGVVGHKTYAAMIQSKKTPLAPESPKIVTPEQIVTTPPPVPAQPVNPVNEQNKQNIQALTATPETPVIPPNVVPIPESNIVFPEQPPVLKYRDDYAQTSSVFGDHNSILDTQKNTPGINRTNGNQPGFLLGLGLLAKTNNAQNESNYDGSNNSTNDNNRRKLFQYDRANSEASINLEAIPSFVMRNRQGEVIRPFGKLRDKISDRKYNRQLERESIDEAISARLNGENSDYVPSSKREAKKYKRKFDNALSNQIQNEREQIELEGYNQNAVNLNDMSSSQQAEWIMNNYKEEQPVGTEIKQEGGDIINLTDILPQAQGGSYSNDFAKNPPQTVELNSRFPDGRTHNSYSDYLTNVNSGLGTKTTTKTPEPVTPIVNTAPPKVNSDFQYNPTRLLYYGNRMQSNANMLPVLYNTSKALFDKPEVQRPIYNKQDQAVLAGLNNNKINANYNNINTGRVVAMDAIRNNARGSGSLMTNLIAANANANRQMNDEAYRVNQSNQAQENMYLNKLNEVGTNRQLENKYVDEANRKHRLSMEEFRRDALESGEKAMINKGQLLNSELNNQMQIEGYLNQIGADYKFVQDGYGNLKVQLRDKDGNSRLMSVGTDSKGLLDMYRNMGATYNNTSKQEPNPVDKGQSHNITSTQAARKNGGKVYKRKFLF